jgi:hypothetical protein
VGWAGLVPLYLIVGRGLSAHEEDEVIRGHGRTATGWGMALTALAALWSFTDLTSGTASAVSHAILCASSALGAALWRRPKVLYLASLLSLSAATFGFAELGLGLEQMGIGWASLAIGHLILALILGRRPAARAFAPPLVTAGYAAAALSQAPSLFPYDGPLLAYTLGNWIALAAWGARLAHAGRPGFARHIGAAGEREDGPEARLWGPRLLQWGAALPLPAWLWVVFLNRREPDFSFALALATLAWGLVALGHRLARIRGAYRRPWDTVGLLTSAGAPVAAFVVAGEGFAPALCLLATGVLWLCDAAAVRRRPGLLPGGLVIGWGAALLLDRLHVAPAAITFALGALAALYLLAGLWAERRRSALWTARFLAPLYLSAHLLLLATLGRIYFRPLESVVVGTPWGDEVRLWAAAAQVLLGAVYGLYAWGRYRERWAHLAAWLGAAGGGFLFTVYSQGRGSSAFKVAAIAVVFVLAERGLHGLQQARRLGRRRRAFFRLAWRLYRRPCLVTGWIVSAGTIGLALIRNLLILGGGRVQQTWAAAGLLTIVALYALAARLFRRAHFAWFAALLVVAPWTILCNLGWYSAWRPTLPGFAIGWAALAWLLLGLALWIRRAGLRRYPQDREKNSLRGDTARSLGMEYIPRGIAAHARWRAYGRPLRVVAHVLLPFSLLWGVGDVDTGRVTFGLAVAFYGLCAYLDARRFGRDAPDRTRTAGGAARFRYPALALIPVWGVYVLAWLLPDARHEHYGLMFLACGPLGLLAGRRLLPPIRPAPSGAAAEGRLPAYLAAYGALIVGTLLVAHDTALLSLALLFDSVWMVVSARLFRNPLWIYAAAAMAPLALVLALPQAGIDANRHGWWLIGLAAVYLALAWLLRRVRLEAYGTGVLALGFALIALGLPPSSRDQVGAMWGYGGAAALYVLTAIWLRQPLLLTPACALAVVPYAIALRRSALAPAYYGLALLPGAAVALGVGRGLDARLGTRRGFPWFAPARWPAGAAARLLEWWALAPYALGLGLATASPFFTDGRAGLAALNWALVTAVYGWAVARFRLRGWLLAAGAATHLAAYFTLDALGWWAFPADAWLRFLPVTTATTAAALTVERARGEGSPLDLGRALGGWSRPLYLLAGIDVLAAQALSVSLTPAGAWVSMAHAGLLALLASMWRAPALIYAAAALGAGALGEWAGARGWPAIGLPVVFARLALGYGAAGFGLGLARTHRLRPLAPRDPPPWLAAWAKPLRRSSLVLSGGVLVLGAILGQDLAGWTVRALLGMPFREIVDLATVQMAVGVLSLLGLLYVGAAVFYRRERLSYAALGLLLAGWTLYAFYVQRWAGLRRVQWYAMPAGAYLLSVAYMEWRRDNRTVSRWLDYAATLLMIGSLFGQTLRFGWQFAMLLGGEGFAFLWWGSARRLRRFFYVGMVGVILATVGQLINSLQSINQWIVFGIIGLLLIGVAVLLERRMEAIRASLQRVLEDWE